jgi:asparagine synthase (glutamine-hydrolysing)
MSGFAGFIHLDGLPGTADERMLHLQAMGRQLARRGPDGEQFHDDGVLSFVFRRLAIGDAGEGGQPCWNEDHSIVAVIDGRIYNAHELRDRLRDRHSFRSQSNAELVVHLYEELGPALLDELDGMFALLVWDTRSRKLLLARDRLGIKPLVYAGAGGGLLFGSELKALLAHPLCPRELDWSGIGARDERLPTLPTCVRDVHFVLGGHRIIYGPDRNAIPRPWWSIRDHVAAAHKRGSAANDGRPIASGDDYVDAYADLLSAGVRKQLPGDGPVGLFLSGGIDSTLLAAVASKVRADVHCFTVLEDTTVLAGDVEQARRATERLGLPFHPVRFDQATLPDELNWDLSRFEFLVWAVEIPRFSVEFVLKHELHRYAKTVVPGLKVLLLGQGADGFASGASRELGRELPTWEEHLVRSHSEDRYRICRGLDIPRRFLPLLAESYPAAPAAPNEEHLWLKTFALQHYPLWHEDRTSAAQGIEARLPFLDHHIVEMLASVPARRQAELFHDKRIIRSVLARHLPEYPANKEKVPFVRTPSNASIARLLSGLLDRMFPEFRAKYLERPDPVFSPRRLYGIRRRLMSESRFDRNLLDAMFECMAIAIFHDQCRTLPASGPPRGVDPPSPLREARLGGPLIADAATAAAT